MKNNSLGTRLRIAICLVVLFACCAFTLVSSLKVLGPADGGPVVLLFMLLGFWLFLGAIIKVRLLLMLPRETNVVPQSPAEFSAVPQVLRSPLPEVVGSAGNQAQEPLVLDFNGFEIVTAELLKLGFRSAREGRVKTNRANAMPIYIRMFEHASGAFAEIHQVFPPKRAPRPISMGIFTYYPDGWIVGDSNETSNWVIWLVRRPRSVTRGHERIATVRDIWSAHLARRAAVERGLGLQAQPHTVEDHLARSREHFRWMRSAAFRRSLLIAFVHYNFFRPRNREWWGEFHRFAKS